MAADATFVRDWNKQALVAIASVAVREVWQTADGKAAVYAGGADGRTTGDAGRRVEFETADKWTFLLTSGITILDGGRVYWDHSANLAHFKKVNDRDFYLGRAVGDSSAGAVVVDLNSNPPPDIDMFRDAALVVPVGTQAVGGFGFPKVLGGARSIELTSTSEAQKIDMLSVDGFAKGANAIVEMVFRIADDGAGTAADLSLGIASATHATDASSITNRLFFHTDANALDIFAESSDGSTTVALTDTTINYAEGSAVANRVECWIDFRNPADPQLYIDGVNVLPSSVFNVDAFAGPWFLLAHLEKTSSADVYRAIIDRFEARFAEQG